MDYSPDFDEAAQENTPCIVDNSVQSSPLYQELASELEELKQKNTVLEQTLALTQQQYHAIQSSVFWKITKPIRLAADKGKFICGKTQSFFTQLRTYGIRFVIGKLFRRVRKFFVRHFLTIDGVYTKTDLLQQRSALFPQNITISILVPLYNTPLAYLQEMIASVLAQTYQDWELCLSDGSDDDHTYVGEACLRFAQQDSRIRYQKLSHNMGISGNTNACIQMSTGSYIALFDHDDRLHPSALYEVMNAICRENADFIYTDEATFQKSTRKAYNFHYKPDYSPDTLRSYNYICHLSVFSKALLEQAGNFNSNYDGSQDYDLILRLTERAKKIVHIPIVLYYWRAHSSSTAQSVASKPYVIDSAKRALSHHLARVGLNGTVCDAAAPTTYRIRYQISGNPKVSIVIPNMDHVNILKACIDSILQKTTYKNFEILIIENNSKEKQTFDYYDSLKSNSRIKIVTWSGIFNYSAINNYGIREAAAGDYYLLLNNDITVITPDWIQEMLMFAQRPDVGAVGAMLYYPDDTIQHGGVILGIGGVASHAHKGFPRGSFGYFDRAAIAQNFSAVTAACMMVPKHVWEETSGLDEKYQVAFNDVDLCMRIRSAGYLIVWTPFAELYHHESKSRGTEDTPEKQARFASEVNRFMTQWQQALAAGDPYYNPNLTLEEENFSQKE